MSPVKPQKITEITYQPHAECDECSFKTGPSSYSRNEAKSHVRRTGHDVRVIIEKVALWGAR